jgi:hypothetical protein
MINTETIKSKIISFIERNGPSLPIQISKEIGMNSIFTSAFLSELLDSKKIKTSSLRVGGTSLYLISGQEEQLEKFYKYLHPKEAEAFEMLKKSKILKDSDQEPAIRVALRAIKDFAFSFKDDDQIYWKGLTTTESEIKELFYSKVKKEKIEEIEKPIETFKKEEIKPLNQIEEIDTQKKAVNIQSSANLESSESKDSEPTKIKKKKQIKEIESKQEKLEFNNPLVTKPIEKPKKEKPHSEFVVNTILFLNKNNFRIIDEKEHRVKEYTCIVEINSDLGKIQFYTNAKDKKTISDSDLQKLLSTGQSIPLPALMLYTGELSKKAKEYLEKYSSILKARKIT